MIRQVTVIQQKEDCKWAKLKGIDVSELKPDEFKSSELKANSQSNRATRFGTTGKWPDKFTMRQPVENPDISEYLDLVGDGSPRQEAIHYKAKYWVNG